MTIQQEIRSIPYFCPSCESHVGDFVEISDGSVRLDAGGWLISDGMHHCHRCGRLIHFRAPKDSWNKLVERYLTRCGTEA